jgi:predicted DNA-binding helix-hairpin-helix protein
MILRVPGIGVKSAQMIVSSRRYGRLGFWQLKKIGIVMKRAQYFITCNELPSQTIHEIKPENLRLQLTSTNRREQKTNSNQLLLSFAE